MTIRAEINSTIKKAIEGKYNIEIFQSEDGTIFVGANVAESHENKKSTLPHLTLRTSAISLDDFDVLYDLIDWVQDAVNLNDSFKEIAWNG